jgi:hypothetical protein
MRAVTECGAPSAAYDTLGELSLLEVGLHTFCADHVGM